MGRACVLPTLFTSGEDEMTTAQIRAQLASKRAQYADAQKKAGQLQTKESTKRSEAAKARLAAEKAKSAGTAKAKLSEAERRSRDAEAAGKEAARWTAKAAGYAKEVLSLETKLSKAEVAEQKAVNAKRDREQQQRDRRQATANRELSYRLATTEQDMATLLHSLPEPQPEKLRVLLLTAADGDLRVGREVKRIQAAVKATVRRDYIEFDIRPAATPGDLLDGITEFRPHVIHFSGHSDETFIVFEEDTDDENNGVEIPAAALARAIGSVDTPPGLVVLNSCSSAAQAEELVKGLIPFAIGMADQIDDTAAIAYAARFYGAIANGQSIQGAHQVSRSGLELEGIEDQDLPTLAVADGYDAGTTVLVTP